MSSSRFSHSPSSVRDCKTYAVMGGYWSSGGDHCRWTPAESRLANSQAGGFSLLFLGLRSGGEGIRTDSQTQSGKWEKIILELWNCHRFLQFTSIYSEAMAVHRTGVTNKSDLRAIFIVVMEALLYFTWLQICWPGIRLMTRGACPVLGCGPGMICRSGWLVGHISV